MRFIKRMNQRGDTIAEVLICLAILSLVLSSAYVLTNRNQSTAQIAQERSESLKIADSQLELLRAYTDKHTLPTNDYFCLQTVGSDVQVVNMSDNPAGASPAYPAACTTGPAGRYTFVIWSPARATAVGGNGNSFAVTSRWSGITAQNEEVKVFYSVFNTNSPAYAQPPTDVTPAPECSDGRDNNDTEDALADEFDPACFNNGIPTGNRGSPTYVPLTGSETNPRCNNGSDDDADTRVDSADSGCHSDGNIGNAATYSRTDNDETSAVCSNGSDDDADGRVDYPADPGCSNYIDNNECDPPSQVTVSTGSLGFESWHLYNTGGTRPSLTFTVRNPSNCAPVHITSTPISGASTSSFSITSNGCSNRTLNAGVTCSITAQFYPPSGGGNHRLSNAGNKTAAITINNSDGLASPPSVSLAGNAYAEVLGPGDELNISNSSYLRVYNMSCYRNVEACGSPFTGIAGNGNLYLGGTYCLWGGGYINNIFAMQGDGNLVFYDQAGGVRYASWTFGGNFWLRLQPDGGVYITNGQYGSVVKWIHSGGTCFAW